jgi:ubiquinone/menaquinone biosynthesis C-methylase UbiE
MLLYPGAGIEVIDGFRVEEEKPTVATLEAEAFEGEHNKRSHAYILVLWLVSIWAMITNFTQAFSAKLFKKQKTAFVKILWEMGRNPDHISSSFVDRFSKFNHQSKIGAAGWRSLDIFYNYYEKVRPQLDGNFEGWITRYWIGKMENRQAVTNRLKIVVNLLEDAFKKFINEPEIRLVSVASGSAQAIIRAMQKYPHLCVKATLIDIDETAIEVSRQKVKEAGLEDCFTFVKGTTNALEEICQEFRPHIIEMVGFLDYRPKKKAIQLINRIKYCLSPGGYFLTCNIRKNREKIFLDWVLLWPMIYRNEKQFAELLVKGGFSPKKINLFYEPFRIHGIGVCQK